MPESLPEGQVEAPQTTENTVDQTPESATGSQAEGGILDAVKAALGEAPEASPPSEAGTDTSREAADPATDPEAIPAEELAQYKPKTRERIETLLNTVKSEREQTAKLKEEITSFKADAEKFQQLSSFVRDNAIDPKDVDNSFAFMAEMRSGNYLAAFERLRPVYEQLRSAVGEELPGELRERVNLGYISEADARKLSALEAKDRIAAASAEQRRQIEQTASQQRAHEQKVEQARSAVATWEEQQKTRNPDWPLLAPRVAKEIELELRRRGSIPDPQEAVKLANDVLDGIVKDYGRFKQPARSMTPVVGASATRSAPEPKSALDAVKMGLGIR